MLISCAGSRPHVAVSIFKLVSFIHSLMPRFSIHSNIAVIIFRHSISCHIPILKKKSFILRQSKARRLLLFNWLQSYFNEEEVWRSDLLDLSAQRGKS